MECCFELSNQLMYVFYIFLVSNVLFTLWYYSFLFAFFSRQSSLGAPEGGDYSAKIQLFDGKSARFSSFVFFSVHCFSCECKLLPWNVHWHHLDYNNRRISLYNLLFFKFKQASLPTRRAACLRTHAPTVSIPATVQITATLTSLLVLTHQPKS